MIESLKCLIRPYTVVVVITTIAFLAIYLGIRFASAELAREVIIFLLGAGGIIVGMLFGERASKAKAEK